MSDSERTVYGFRFMPPSLAAWIGGAIPEKPFMGEIPWTPLCKPVAQTTFALMTSAGISVLSDPPFDMARERREPTWGDPTFRAIPREAGEADVTVSHLHITTEFINQDLNVILPLARFRELEKDGRIGRLAPTSYSFYGYQPDPAVLLNETMPRVAERMQAEGVEAVFLTPA